ncbi:MAG TPA: ferritin-like protein [Candidatus Dormibacteraeota bacterium]|nr:ferritin-like protein [Candidatus Dormibacteraeota bacterium]
MGQDRQAALRTSDREELIFLLSEASELEHGLCCCYLFAAFSLKRGLDEGLTATELEALARWERAISHVAVQEMLHLAMASNLLTALGAAPHLRRPNFPQQSKYYPSFQMSLRRFDERTLDHFIFIERPEGMDIPDAPGFVASPTPTPGPPADGLEPVEVPYSSVAVLYRDIEEGLKALCARYGEDRVFIGPPRAQATSAFFPFPGITPVTDLASALKVIELIVEQGEGLRGDIADSHYARFLAIRGELDRLRADRPDFEPARSVMENPFTEAPIDAAGFNLIDNPDAWAVSDLFNVSYGLMVELLMRFFAHTEETNDELHALVTTAIGVMRGVIKPLGAILTSLPATTAGDSPRAGPSFAFYRSIDYLPHRNAAWAVFEERFTELVEYSAKLVAADSKGVGLDRVHETLEGLAAGLRKHRRNAIAPPSPHR